MAKKQSKKTADHPDFSVKRSSAGLGLYSKKEFSPEDFLLEYTGEEISHPESDRRGGRYLFTLNEKIVIDGKERHNTGRYLNHSCDPNAEAVIEDDKRVIFLAIKKIAIGDEITFDYGKEYVDDFIAKAGCKCTSCSPQ